MFFWGIASSGNVDISRGPEMKGLSGIVMPCCSRAWVAAEIIPVAFYLAICL